ncbi:hypothetical protein BPUM_2622 [Bacillus pumilus SAFR-032]|uniref:Uncharacterized protein n=1 Tax=Bacillus pumilus (strain SAFR-032) TaxID=315750 RepID=A8FGB3_BACP2|nr:hypothetical protein BPUM_2622 [Bacillus pumilus SAFR-032]
MLLIFVILSSARSRFLLFHSLMIGFIINKDFGIVTKIFFITQTLLSDKVLCVRL